MNNYVVFIALLPSILLGFYIYKNDTQEKEPTKLLFKLFMGGIGAVVLTLVVSFTLSFSISGLDDYLESNLLAIFFDAFIFVALVEEGSKWIFLKLISWKDKAFDYLYDGVVYAVFVSLGFATLENLLYVLDGGIGVAIMRAFLSVPGHVCDAVFMGYFYGLAKIATINSNQKLARKNMFLSIFVPTVLHGFYDFCLMSNISVLALIFFAFIIILYVLVFRKIKRLSKIKFNIYGIIKEEKMVHRYCSNCGTYVENYNFCPRCGTRKEEV